MALRRPALLGGAGILIATLLAFPAPPADAGKPKPRTLYVRAGAC